jgi:hypothetical protein
MIVQFSADADPTVTEIDRFDRLSATVDGTLAAARLGVLGRIDADGEHIWLDIDALRAELGRIGLDGQPLAEFEGMISYAERAGWVDSDGTAVRAHIAASEGD